MKSLPTVIQEFRLELLGVLQQVMEEAELTSTCLNCKRFDEATETCGQVHPPVRPPARVIAFGCPQFDEDDVDAVPFEDNRAPAVVALRAAPKPALKSGFDDFDDDIPF
jgi:hypothetical protein